MSFVAIIPGPPVGQSRGRAGAVYRKGAGGRPEPVLVNGRVITRVHDSASSYNWKATAQDHIKRALGDRPPLEGPILALVESVFPCPRSDYRKSEPRRRRWNLGQKDVDNLAKAALDSANGVAWRDDREVAFLLSVKVTGHQNELPFVRLSAWELRLEPGAVLGEMQALLLGMLQFDAELLAGEAGRR